MPPIHRILIKTHHMTSRKKILALTKSAKRLSCAVLLKTGSPPGIMLAEGELAGDWLEVVRKLRYKDFRLMKKELVQKRGLDVEYGGVKELSSVKEFGAFLERGRERVGDGDGDIFGWWRTDRSGHCRFHQEDARRAGLGSAGKPLKNGGSAMEQSAFQQAEKLQKGHL
ncbi:uncharacterized protein RCO7_04568 [Rhynchosporium graminicola]|uniref:Uncharacterized protein n=1 Tax=Rhynchosporium graminicola TaxID=2792576 RepID=A0A1E1JXB4_9HELO|nr:uncharacterized protein RCO7_04568 [Rhynchosporium commune]